MAKQGPDDVHAQCYKESQLLESLFTKHGMRESEHTILANLLSPHTTHTCSTRIRIYYDKSFFFGFFFWVIPLPSNISFKEFYDLDPNLVFDSWVNLMVLDYTWYRA